VQLQVETWGTTDRRDSRKHFSSGKKLAASDWRLRPRNPQLACRRRPGIDGWFRALFAWREMRVPATGLRRWGAKPETASRDVFALAHDGREEVIATEAWRATQIGAARRGLSRGLRHIEWTFDPLEIKNAFLNIHKLGAIVRSYHVDF